MAAAVTPVSSAAVTATATEDLKKIYPLAETKTALVALRALASYATTLSNAESSRRGVLEEFKEFTIPIVDAPACQRGSKEWKEKVLPMHITAEAIMTLALQTVKPDFVAPTTDIADYGFKYNEGVGCIGMCVSRSSSQFSHFLVYFRGSCKHLEAMLQQAHGVSFPNPALTIP